MDKGKTPPGAENSADCDYTKYLNSKIKFLHWQSASRVKAMQEKHNVTINKIIEHKSNQSFRNDQPSASRKNVVNIHGPSSPQNTSCVHDNVHINILPFSSPKKTFHSRDDGNIDR